MGDYVSLAKGVSQGNFDRVLDEFEVQAYQGSVRGVWSPEGTEEI